jgi:putative membrane protein
MREIVKGRMVVALLCVAVAAAASCDDDDGTLQNDDTNSCAGNGAGGGGGSGGGGGADGGTDAAAQLSSDGQVAGVVVEANSGEVHAGTIARVRSRNEAVRAFAGRMITEHSAANEMMDALLLAQGLVAADSQTRQTLSGQATQTLNSLWAASPSGFDVAYADSQVAMHTMVLNLLDSTLIPTAQNAQLKASLQTMRQAVATHLAAAQQLRASLSADGGTTGDGATTADGGGDAADGGASGG